MIKDSYNEKRTEISGLHSPVIMVGKADGASEQDQHKHHVAALMNAFRRAWWMAIPLGICLSAASSFAAWKLFVPKYAASAYLRIDADDRPLIFKTADDSAGRGNDFRLYKNTHQQLLLTPFVLNAALRETQVSSLAEVISQDDPIFWLQSNLKVKFPGDGEIMQISIETESKNSCVQIVNGVVNAFMQEVVMSEHNDRSSRLSNLERVYSDAESKVRSKQAQLKSLASALGTSDSHSLTVAQQSTLTQYGKMTEKLSEVQFSLMQAEGEVRMAEEFNRRQKEAESQSKTDETVPLSSESDERTADVIRMEEDIAVLMAHLKSMSKNFGRTHPSVIKTVSEIEVKKQLLENRKTDAKQRSKMSSVNLVRPSVLVAHDLGALTMRTQILANQEKILRDKVEKLSEETKQLGRSSIDVELMRSEISGLEEVLRRVGEEAERTRIELKTASRIKRLSQEATASNPDSTKRLTRVICIGTLAFAAPFGLLVVWDFSRKRVNNGEGTSQSLSIPTIGMIPMVGTDPLRRGRRISQSTWSRTRAELDGALASLASMILFSSQTDNRKVFMVSSAMPSEGKSTVACQLAQGLAKAGKSVVLVDFDLRRPSVHRYLELELEPGVADALDGNLSFEEALQKTDLANLSVMTAGNWSGNLDERCSSGAIDDLFDFLRRSFDMVIIDSSPVLPVHDARVIGKFSDGVVLTLIRDRSRLPEASKACEILKSYGVKVLGTIIIGVSSRTYPSYYPLPPKYRDKKRLSKK